MTTTNEKRRMLVVVDIPAIHDDFRKILARATPARSALDDTRALLFDEVPPAPLSRFELDSVYQWQKTLARVEASLRERRRYAMAFVDMRMPPGWDGVETIEQLWPAARQESYRDRRRARQRLDRHRRHLLRHRAREPVAHLRSVFHDHAVGQGTGLGLSLSYGIVQKHCGRIEVDSAVGRGRCFCIWLSVRPVGEDAAKPNP